MRHRFLIQKDSPLSVESLQLIEEIEAYNRINKFSKIEYLEIDISELVNFQEPGYIPVGSLQFVAHYLLFGYGITHMAPIEVPMELMRGEFLLREYNTVLYQDMPRTGNYFVKDVTTLKSFSFEGSVESLFSMEDLCSQLIPEHIYQVSSVLKILSEYRVIVIDDKIEAIQYYNGDPTIMPNEKEIEKIKKMVLMYSISENRPSAYSMDVAVVKIDNGRDLALIEVHPAVSIGTYGYTGQKLIDMYAKGFNWYIKNNKPQKYMEIKSKENE